MLYVLLGQVSSKQEELDVLDQAQRGRIPERRSVAYAEELAALAQEGIRARARVWIRTEEEHVVIFTGRQDGEEPTERGGRRILAAIEVDEEGRLKSLLKIVGDYAGDAREWSDHVQDALDRYRRGKRTR